MGQHDALGEAGGPGGILHVADVVRPDAGHELVELPLGRHFGALHRLLEGQASGHAEPHRDHVPKERELPAVERFSGPGRRQLGAEGLDDLPIVGIQGGFDHDQRMGIRLTQQVFRLMDLVRRVHRDQDGADLGRRPEGEIPCGHVRRPHGHLAARPHAQRDQRLGEAIHVVPELRVGPGIVQRRILETVLIRELLHHPIEHLGKGEVDELVLLPHIPSGAVVVRIEHLLLAAGGCEPLHVIHEVGKDHVQLRQILHPFRLPFQGKIPGIVHGIQRPDQVRDGHVALAHQRVGAAAVGIPQVDVLHVGPQVFDRLVRRLPAVPVGVVHVPEHPEGIRSVRIEKGPQLCRIRKSAVGFDQQDDPALLRRGEQDVQIRLHRFEIRLVRPDRHIFRLHGLREPDEERNLVPHRRVMEADAAGAVEHRHGQPLLEEVPVGGRGVVLVQCAARPDQLRVLVGVVHLYPREAVVNGHPAQIRPRCAQSSAGGERKIHCPASS